jgi:chromosome segregation ATPase
LLGEVSASDLAEIKRKKAEIEGRLRGSEVQLDLLRHDLLSSGIRLEESETAKRTIGNLLNEAKDTNAQLEARLMVADSDISALQRSRKKSEGEVEETSIAALEHEIKSLQCDKEALGRQLAKINKEKFDLALQLSSTQKEKERLTDENVGQAMQISELEITSTAIEKNRMACVNEVEKLKAERSSLQTRLEETLSQLHKADAEQKSLASRHSHSEESLKKARGHLLTLQESLKTKVDEEEMVRTTAEAINALSFFQGGGFSEHITEHDTSTSTVRRRVQESQIEKAQLQEEVTLSSKSISQLEGLKTELEKKKHGVESQVKSLDSEKSLIDSRIGNLESSLREVETDKDSLEIELNQSRQELNEAMRQFNEKLEIAARKESKIERLQNLVADHSRSADKKVHAASATLSLKLKTQNQRAVQVIQDLSKELTTLGERYDKFGHKYGKLKQLCNALEAKNKKVFSTKIGNIFLNGPITS